MDRFSMVPDPSPILHTDSICFRCRGNPNLVRLLVIAAAAGRPCSGEYDVNTKTAWLSTDKGLFDDLMCQARGRLNVWIDVGGASASNLGFNLIS